MKSKMFFVLTFLFLPGLMQAQTLNARFSTSVYSWENQFADSTASKSFRGYQTAIIHANGVGMPNLSFHTYFRGAYDMGSGKVTENPQYRVYNMYAQWKNRDQKAHRLDIKAGRQQVLTGLRSPTIDGIRADYSNADNYSVSGYFGALPPDDGSLTVLKPFDRHAMGAKVSTAKYFETKAALTFVDKSRDGAYAHSLNYLGGDSLFQRADMQERLIGFDLNRMFMGKINWFYHFEYDMLQKNVRRVSTDVQYTHNKNLFVGVEYIFRRPNIMYNTIFSSFDDLSTNQEIWLRSNYRINDLWSVNAEYANVFYDLKDAWRYGFGVGFWRTNVNYQRRMGYGGTIDMISAAAYYPVNDKLKTDCSISYARFDLADDIDKNSWEYPANPGDWDRFNLERQILTATNTSIAVTGRVNYEFFRSFNVDVEGQYLSQNIKSSPVYAGNKSDVRLFLRANYWIFHKL
ncbi:hypothetical protein F9K33_11135 [bacterium]|nr:MAG: hypothetical protein F9K33_11135 [bacterium]